MIIEELEQENRELHQVIARQTEQFQKDMEKKIGFLQGKLDQLTESLNNYDTIINLHKSLGEKR